MERCCWRIIVLALLLWPGAALAQSSGIAGVVRDSTGAVLPGVTIEASSPALIERVRTAVSGDGGQYRIVDLRPGLYASDNRRDRSGRPVQLSEPAAATGCSGGDAVPISSRRQRRSWDLCPGPVDPRPADHEPGPSIRLSQLGNPGANAWTGDAGAGAQPADSIGKSTKVHTGVDLTINARLPNSALLQGGLNTGRTVIDNCEIMANAVVPATPSNTSAGALTFANGNPSQRFCRVAPKFLTQVKLQGSYPLPFDSQFSAAFQSIAGPEITAARQFPNAEIAPGLGRNLSAGAGGVANVQLIEPGTLYGERTYQLDLRVSKKLAVSRARLEAMVDVYNVLNTNPVLALNTTYGPNWLVPQIVLPARFFKFSTRVSF